MIHSGDFIKPQFTNSKTDSFVMEWVVPENLPYFDGHFPNHPVLPAVALVDFSLEIIKGILKDPTLEMKSIKSGKFYEIIAPNRHVRIQIGKKALKEWEILWLDSERPGKKLAKIHLEIFQPS